MQGALRSEQEGLQQFEEHAEERKQDRADHRFAGHEASSERLAEERPGAVLQIRRELVPDRGDDTADRHADHEDRREDEREAERRGDGNPPEAGLLATLAVVLLEGEKDLEEHTDDHGDDGRRQRARRQSRNAFFHHHGQGGDLQSGRSRELAFVQADAVGFYEQIEHERGQDSAHGDHDEHRDDQGLELATEALGDPERGNHRLRRGLRGGRSERRDQVATDMRRPDEAEHELRCVSHERNRTLPGDAEDTQARDDQDRLDCDGEHHLRPGQIEPRTGHPDDDSGRNQCSGHSPPAGDLFVSEARFFRRPDVFGLVTEQVSEGRDGHARQSRGDHHAGGRPHHPLNEVLEVGRRRGQVNTGLATVCGEEGDGRVFLGARELGEVVHVSVALVPVRRESTAHGGELGHGRSEGVDDPDAEQAGKADGERDQHAEADGRELQAEHHLHGAVADHRGDDAKAVLEEGAKASDCRAHAQDIATLAHGFGSIGVGQGLGDAQHRRASRPGKRFVAQNGATGPDAHEHAEDSGGGKPQRHLPPRGIEAHVATEDVLDVVEGREHNHHEADATADVDHRLDDVQLDGELLVVRRVFREQTCSDEHAEVREVDAHAELQGHVRDGHCGDRTDDGSENEQAPGQVLFHFVPPKLSHQRTLCHIPMANYISLLLFIFPSSCQFLHFFVR